MVFQSYNRSSSWRTQGIDSHGVSYCRTARTRSIPVAYQKRDRLSSAAPVAWEPCRADAYGMTGQQRRDLVPAITTWITAATGDLR